VSARALRTVAYVRYFYREETGDGVRKQLRSGRLDLFYGVPLRSIWIRTELGAILSCSSCSSFPRYASSTYSTEYGVVSNGVIDLYVLRTLLGKWARLMGRVRNPSLQPVGFDRGAARSDRAKPSLPPQNCPERPARPSGNHSELRSHATALSTSVVTAANCVCSCPLPTCDFRTPYLPLLTVPQPLPLSAKQQETLTNSHPPRPSPPYSYSHSLLLTQPTTTYLLHTSQPPIFFQSLFIVRSFLLLLLLLLLFLCYSSPLTVSIASDPQPFVCSDFRHHAAASSYRLTSTTRQCSLD
jgi:hypothetical protein